MWWCRQRMRWQWNGLLLSYLLAFAVTKLRWMWRNERRRDLHWLRNYLVLDFALKLWLRLQQRLQIIRPHLKTSVRLTGVFLCSAPFSIKNMSKNMKILKIWFTFSYVYCKIFLKERSYEHKKIWWGCRTYMER